MLAHTAKDACNSYPHKYVYVYVTLQMYSTHALTKQKIPKK